MYPSDSDLDYYLNYHRSMVLLLTEVKEARGENEHGVQSWTEVPAGKKKSFKGIATVTCKCGHLTAYKKPLNALKDFECPKKGR